MNKMGIGDCLSILEKKIQEQDKNDINELQGPKITTNEINEQLQDNQNDNIIIMKI